MVYFSSHIFGHVHCMSKYKMNINQGSYALNRHSRGKGFKFGRNWQQK